MKTKNLDIRTQVEKIMYQHPDITLFDLIRLVKNPDNQNISQRYFNILVEQYYNTQQYLNSLKPQPDPNDDLFDYLPVH